MKHNAEAEKLIYDSVNQIADGRLTLIVQDNRILQINLDEKYGQGSAKRPVHEEKGLASESDIRKQEIKKLLDLAKNVKFGSVTAVIYQGAIVQVEKTEKIRMT